MKEEFSAGAVIFRRVPEGTRFLLLQYPEPFDAKHEPYWSLLQGHIESGEQALDTVRREVREETAITDLQFVEGFAQTISHEFKRPEGPVLKIVQYFLAETKTEAVTLVPPHLAFAWLTLGEALERMKFENGRRVLTAAAEFFEQKGE